MTSNETFHRICPPRSMLGKRAHESGWRTKCIMLFPIAKHVSDNVAAKCFAHMHKVLSLRFGGYSDRMGGGGWIDPDTDASVDERHCELSVSYKPNAENDAWLQDFAEYNGRILGQKWMHIEFHTFRVGHVKVR